MNQPWKMIHKQRACMHSVYVSNTCMKKGWSAIQALTVVFELL